MATMEHCAFGNTASDMRIALEKLKDLQDLEDLSQCELRGFKSLIHLCQKFLDAADGLTEEND